jgi:hypothetical protein
MFYLSIESNSRFLINRKDFLAPVGTLCESKKIPRIVSLPAAVLADERSQWEKASARHTFVPNCAFSRQAGNYENN